MSITNFKKPNKHTPGVQSARTKKTTVVEQKEYNISSQILEGNRKITNDEFLSLCVLFEDPQYNFFFHIRMNLVLSILVIQKKSEMKSMNGSLVKLNKK